VQAGAADAADVHARPFANRLEPLEDGDVFGGVVGHGAQETGVRKQESGLGLEPV